MPTTSTSERYPYSVVVPAGWLMTPAVPSFQATPDPDVRWETGQRFRIDQAAGFDHWESADRGTDLFIASQPLPTGTTLEEWVEVSIENMRQPIHDCSDPLPELDEQATLDGEPVRLLAFLCHDETLHGFQVPAVHGDQGWMVGLWGAPDDVTEDRAIFEEILASFRFTE